MTGFRLTPDSAITGIKKEINNKSECGALASSFGVRRRFFFVRFIIVNIIFTEILLALLHNDMPYELSYNCMDINVTMKLPPPVLDWSQLILVLWRNNQLGGEALGLDHVVDKKRMRGPTSKVDLCKKENQDMVLQWWMKGK